jgi:hypothetical protein
MYITTNENYYYHVILGAKHCHQPCTCRLTALTVDPEQVVQWVCETISNSICDVY